MHNFDGNLLFELGIGALGKVNLSHPARTQGAQHPIRSYAISHHFRSMRRDKVICKPAALAAGCSLRV